jgi:ankyrin repeat protein
MGADRNIKDTRGQLPLEIAKDIGDVDLMRLLEDLY